MTDIPSDVQGRPRGWFAYLRQRSAIIFTIGFAISVASFVEHLHMGKDAIAYVVNQLATIDGWEGFVRAAAAIFHATLEWWRGVLRDLLSFLPFQTPQWLHDPISVLFFSFSRIWSASSRYWLYRARGGEYVYDSNHPTGQWRPREDPDLQEHSKFIDKWRQQINFVWSLIYVFAFLVLPMISAIFVDRGYYDSQKGFDFGRVLEEPGAIISYVVILLLFAVAFVLGRRRQHYLREQIDETYERHEQRRGNHEE